MGAAYRGINVFLLSAAGYGSPYWLTYKQATERGGHVRKGEHGTKVVFWKIGTRETEDADGDTIERKSILLRYYTVFNVEQCEGIASPTVAPAVNRDRGMRAHRLSDAKSPRNAARRTRVVQAIE